MNMVEMVGTYTMGVYTNLLHHGCFKVLVNHILDLLLYATVIQQLLHKHFIEINKMISAAYCKWIANYIKKPKSR